jgi:hypothetical protein
MSSSPVATQIHKSLDVHRHFTTQVALYGDFRNLYAELLHFRLREILDLGILANACRFADYLRTRTTNAEYRLQRDFGVLVIRNVHPCNTRHSVRSVNKEGPQKGT